MKYIILILALCLGTARVHAQERNRVQTATLDSATLKRKTVEMVKEFYGNVRSVVEDCSKYNISVVTNYCRKAFWPDAKIEIINTKSGKEVALKPLSYFTMLYHMYCSDDKKYDDNSTIRWEDLGYEILPWESGYRVKYRVKQTTRNKKGDEWINTDVTEKVVIVFFLINEDEKGSFIAKIARVDATAGFLKSKQ